MTIKTGIERLDTVAGLLHKKSVGLITNHTGVDKTMTSSIDLLARKTRLKALFAPEHGVRGDKQAGETLADDIDRRTGCPVHSLYGKTKRPTPRMLEPLDILCYDIQDVGARFYTYIYTMLYAMEAAKDTDIPFVVFDRPNPLGGVTVEGTMLQAAFTSFVGEAPLVQRYALTIGELARFFNETRGIGCDLHVVEIEGWHREMDALETDMPWIMPSPNLPTPLSAFAYIATCLLEGTNVSEGRGTTKPFELFGAPWLNAHETIEALRAQSHEGVLLRETVFVPTFSKHAGEPCRGVEMILTDRKKFRPARFGLALIHTLADLHTDFLFLPSATKRGKPMIDLLSGDDDLRSGRLDLEALFAKEADARKTYASMKARYHLYA